MILPASFSLDRRMRRGLPAVAALLAPALVVQMVRFTTGWQPATTQAATTQPADQAAVVLTPLAALSAQQTNLAAALATGGPLDPLAVTSPMDHTPAPVEPDQPPTADPADASAPEGTPQESAPRMKMQLGAIMGGSAAGAALSVINGRVYRVGDQIEPGWTITAIDSSTLSVEFQGPKQQTFTLTREGR